MFKESIKKEKHYGVAVYCHTDMDNLRKSECLCLNCSRCSGINKCESAIMLMQLCVNNNLALAVTRCPNYIEK